MNQVIFKPYLYFLVFAIIVLVLGRIKPNEVLDINIGDTYYIIKYSHLSILLAIYGIVISVVYFSAEKFQIELNSNLVYAHTFITIGGIALIGILFQFLSKGETKNFEAVLKEIQISKYLNYSIFFITIIWAIVQLFLVVNFIIGGFSRFAK